MGNSRGWDGLQVTGRELGGWRARTIPAVVLTRGQNDVFPLANLSVDGNELRGLPDDLRGTGGGPGGRLIDTDFSIEAAGGPGANGGAGLAIICRGMSFGVSASITLNGADSAPPPETPIGPTGITAHAGCGGAGGPGALLILLDGNNLSVPDVTGKFVAATGAVPQPGHVMTSRDQTLTPGPSVLDPENSGNPWNGYQDPSLISELFPS